MKWTTFLLLGFVLEVFGQHSISYIEVPAYPTLSTKNNYVPKEAIPIDIAHGMAFVNANLGGETGKFLLDTGAPLLVLNQKTEDSQKKIGATSVTSNFDISSIKVKEFTWAGIYHKNLDALALDMNHIEQAAKRTVKGIIGYDILKNYEVLIDYENKQLWLLQSGNNKLHIAAEPIATLEFELQDHLPVIEVQIDGQKFRFGLDTGAGVNLLDVRHRDLLSQKLAVNTNLESLRAIDQTTRLTESVIVEQTQISTLPVDKMKYLFTDLHHLKSNTALDIDGVFGFSFFEKVKCSIDYPNRKLYIWSIVN